MISGGGKITALVSLPLMSDIIRLRTSEDTMSTTRFCRDIGRSPTAKHFGLHGMIEARDYIAHPLLDSRYLECCKALLLHRDKSVEAIIGGWVDKQKLRSSLTLMTEAGIGDVAELCRTLFYGDGRCELTERILKGSLEGG